MKEISFEIPDMDERGVSPVIGVILMVAITVILAAVIASFVLGFGDSVQGNAQAGVSVEDGPSGNVTVTLTSLAGDTDGIKCADSPTNNTESIGSSISCNADTSVVGYIGSNTDPDTETVIRSDL